jgi:hypothetical protein
MPTWLINLLTTVGMMLLSLTVTLIFNKVVGLPRELRRQREQQRARDEQHRLEDQERDDKIAALQAAVNALPVYRAQSLQIQTQLQSTDREILNACNEIKDSMLETRAVLNERLDRLERREKNAIRAKLLNEHRLFTDKVKNPMHAWTEMEHHAFFRLVEDYEELGGNDYVHSVVLPDMNSLEVVRMDNLIRLAELMASRKL